MLTRRMLSTPRTRRESVRSGPALPPSHVLGLLLCLSLPAGSPARVLGDPVPSAKLLSDHARPRAYSLAIGDRGGDGGQDPAVESDSSSDGIVVVGKRGSPDSATVDDAPDISFGGERSWHLDVAFKSYLGPSEIEGQDAALATSKWGSTIGPQVTLFFGGRAPETPGFLRVFYLEGDRGFPNGGVSESQYAGVEIGIGQRPIPNNAAVTLGYWRARSSFSGSQGVDRHAISVSEVTMGCYFGSNPHRAGLQVSLEGAASVTLYAWALCSAFTFGLYQPEALEPTEHELVADAEVSIGYAVRSPAVRVELGAGIIGHEKPVDVHGDGTKRFRGEMIAGPRLSVGFHF